MSKCQDLFEKLSSKKIIGSIEIEMITKTKPFLQRKSYEQEREHFIIRLKDRYGIEITESEYDILVNYKMTKFHSKFKKGADKIIGFVIINNIKVWVLKKKQNDSFATCYPPNIEYDIMETIKCCFPRSVRHLAYYIYELLKEEESTLFGKFNSVKELGIYLYTKPNNIVFRNVHIGKFKKGKLNTFMIMHLINKIIKCKYKTIKILLKRVNADE